MKFEPKKFSSDYRRRTAIVNESDEGVREFACGCLRTREQRWCTEVASMIPYERVDPCKKMQAILDRFDLDDQQERAECQAYEYEHLHDNALSWCSAWEESE